MPTNNNTKSLKANEIQKQVFQLNRIHILQYDGVLISLQQTLGNTNKQRYDDGSNILFPVFYIYFIYIFINFFFPILFKNNNNYYKTMKTEI